MQLQETLQEGHCSTGPGSGAPAAPVKVGDSSVQGRLHHDLHDHLHLLSWQLQTRLQGSDSCWLCHPQEHVHHAFTMEGTRDATRQPSQ